MEQTGRKRLLWRPKRHECKGVMYDLFDLRKGVNSTPLSTRPKIVHVHQSQLSSAFVDRLVEKMRTGAFSSTNDECIDRMIVDISAIGGSEEEQRANVRASLQEFEEIKVKELVIASVGSRNIDPIVMDVKSQQIFFSSIDVQDRLIAYNITLSSQNFPEGSPMLKKVTCITLIKSHSDVDFFNQFTNLEEVHVIQQSLVQDSILKQMPDGSVKFQSVKNESVKSILYYQSYGANILPYENVESVFFLQSSFDIEKLEQFLTQLEKQAQEQKTGQFKKPQKTGQVQEPDQVKKLQHVEQISTDDWSTLKQVMEQRDGQELILLHSDPTSRTNIWSCNVLPEQQTDRSTILDLLGPPKVKKIRVQVCAQMGKNDSEETCKARIQDSVPGVSVDSIELKLEKNMWDFEIWSRAKKAMALIQTIECP